jgi:hypothetical protein
VVKKSKTVGIIVFLDDVDGSRSSEVSDEVLAEFVCACFIRES